MKILVAGHSHVQALHLGWEKAPERTAEEVSFLNIKTFAKLIPQTGVPLGKWPSGGGKYLDPREVGEAFANSVREADAVVLLIQGNEHHALGLAASNHTFADLSAELTRRASSTIANWIDLLQPHIPEGLPVVVLPPPPPLESNELILQRPGIYREVIAERGIRASDERLALWNVQCRVTQLESEKRGYKFLDLPATVFSTSGFLHPDLAGNDPIHGNARYGTMVLSQALKELPAITSTAKTIKIRNPAKHPYHALPDTSYWKQAISLCPSSAVNPVVNPRFLIRPHEAVATAGSCFAQHISRRLRDAGFNFLNMEASEGSDSEGRKRLPYDFSARYGNIYTARQLLQLFDRAHGYFTPIDSAWEREDGTLCDPFRPRVDTAGFSSVDQLVRDREEHLGAVCEMFKRLDIFVFTLGLTECWMSNLDGAVFPLAPGVAGGEFDSERYSFKNFSAAEVADDLRQFLRKLRQVNPRSRVILTVSPVPLVATYEPRHVLVSTIYSKSALRVAAEEVARGEPEVEYFPSYEIIVGPHSGGDYFDGDRRTVTHAGVDHVMRVFMATMTSFASPAAPRAGRRIGSDEFEKMQDLADVACDEELLQKSGTPPGEGADR